jgi:outer membrane protein OmpA-like peptidoglycan-associated protein
MLAKRRQTRQKDPHLYKKTYRREWSKTQNWETPMRMQRIAIAIGVVLAGCTVSQSRVKPMEIATPPPKTSLNEAPAATRIDEPGSYTYELLTPEQTKLAQVFDDTRRTYLTFDVPVPVGLMIFDEGGRAVTFTVGERTVIVAGVRAGLLVRTPTKSSYAQAPKQAALARVQATERGAEGTLWLPAELAAARAEILRAQERLSGLSAELDKASRGEPSTSMAQVRSQIEEIQTAINGVTATLVRAHFSSGSALLALSDEAKAAILAAAARADEIQIRGGTDNSGPVLVNNLLAKERAASMRRLLIEGGIGSDKLHTSSSQAEYIATNSTAAGRAQNRRVDVVFANRADKTAPIVMNAANPASGVRSLTAE